MKDKYSTAETLSQLEWIFVFERIAALARKKEDKLTNEVKPVPWAISFLDLRYFIPFSLSTLYALCNKSAEISVN